MATTLYISYFNTFGIKSKSKNWHFEESRIRGGYNDTSMNLGVRAHMVNEDYSQQNRNNTMIYSGIYNSRTGVNDTNVFSIGEDITKSVDAANGDINKLYAEENDMLIIQEDKTSKILIDKDAIYTAEGQPLQATSNVVLGNTVAYLGEYGTINPESFCSYAGRKYWVDKNRGSVLRLSRDGITEVSNYGMKDFFRDNLKDTTLAVGSFDTYKKHYIISLQGVNMNNDQDKKYYTLNFDDRINGWVTFYTFKPAFGGSLNGQYYTIKNNEETTDVQDLSIWKHHADSSVVNKFYGASAINSKINFVVNGGPSDTKYFKTLSYEGDANWKVNSIKTDSDTGNSILKYTLPKNETELDTFFLRNQFQKQHNKYFAWIKNDTPQSNLGGAVMGWESDHIISGIKGIYMDVEMENEGTTKEELFAVNSNIEKIN